MLVMMLTTLVGTDTPAHKVSHFTRMLEGSGVSVVLRNRLLLPASLLLQ